MADRTKEWAAVVGFGVLGIGLLVVLFSSDFYELDRAEEREPREVQDEAPAGPAAESPAR